MSSRRTGRAIAYGLIYLALAALGALLLAYADGEALAVLSGLLLLLLAGAGGVLVAFDWWSPAHRAGVALATAPSGQPATAFVRSPVPTVMSTLLPSLLAAWAALGVVLAGSPAARVVLAAVALLLLWPVVPVVRGRIAPGGLYLTPTGIEQRKEAVTWSVSWAQVSGAVPGEPLAVTLNGPAPAPAATTRVLWRREPDSPPGVLAVDSRYLAADPTVIAAVVTRCVAQPDLRARLGTPESVREVATLTAR